MQTVKLFFNAINYFFYVVYSFTFFDVIRKLIFDDFHINNATNFVQFILTCIGAVFGYYKLKTYIRDSRVKSEILTEELIAKRQANKSSDAFYNGFQNEFIKPFKEDKK